MEGYTERRIRVCGPLTFSEPISIEERDEYTYNLCMIFLDDPVPLYKALEVFGFSSDRASAFFKAMPSREQLLTFRRQVFKIVHTDKNPNMPADVFTYLYKCFESLLSPYSYIQQEHKMDVLHVTQNNTQRWKEAKADRASRFNYLRSKFGTELFDQKYYDTVISDYRAARKSIEKFDREMGDKIDVCIENVIETMHEHEEWHAIGWNQGLVTSRQYLDKRVDGSNWTPPPELLTYFAPITEPLSNSNRFLFNTVLQQHVQRSR